jgi:hypothetical protein
MRLLRLRDAEKRTSVYGFTRLARARLVNEVGAEDRGDHHWKFDDVTAHRSQIASLVVRRGEYLIFQISGVVQSCSISDRCYRVHAIGMRRYSSPGASLLSCGRYAMNSETIMQGDNTVPGHSLRRAVDIRRPASTRTIRAEMVRSATPNADRMSLILAIPLLSSPKNMSAHGAGHPSRSISSVKPKRTRSLYQDTVDVTIRGHIAWETSAQ